jgi:uncharacterized phage-associated protein
MDVRYSARTIAKWFIAWAEAEEEELSNLKLQKLLYYAQGHHLARFGHRLFTEHIQAWSHGPVVPDVYHEYKSFGSGPVQLPESDTFQWDEVDPQTTQFLSEVWNTYGGYSAGRLRNMTHGEQPWKQSWRGDDERGIVIGPSLLEDYFRQLVPART